MKKLITVLFLVFLLFSAHAGNTVVVVQRVYFTGNNIYNFWQNTGIFNQNTSTANSPGLIWTYDSSYYVFTSGLSMAGYVNNQFAMFACSYKGELSPGYYQSGNYATNPDFRIYTVTGTDNPNSNPDYANWYKMIPFGAPYIDINNNCSYDDGIDKPGVKDASQTLFVSLTDGDLTQHSVGEGFGGGITIPLFKAEIHLTVWVYNISPVLSDIQYMKYQIINKSDTRWDSVYITMMADPDIKALTNDYLGCDSLRNAGFAYSADSLTTSGSYGIRLLKGPVNKLTGDTLRMTAFNWMRYGNYPCEWEPEGLPNYAYNYMKGLKGDGSPILDPTYTPPRRTKFIFPGDPELNTGWTPKKGWIHNCNGVDTGAVTPVYPGDVKFLLSTGAGNFSFAPGDTQNLYYSQMIAIGNTNLNSVTHLKSLSDKADIIFRSGIKDILEKDCVYPYLPDDFSLSDNYPNPFNAVTRIRYSLPRSSNIKLTVYDMLGREVAVLVNGTQGAGYYEKVFDGSAFASGIYFYRLEVIDVSVSSAVHYSRVKKLALVK